MKSILRSEDELERQISKQRIEVIRNVYISIAGVVMIAGVLFVHYLMYSIFTRTNSCDSTIYETY